MVLQSQTTGLVWAVNRGSRKISFRVRDVCSRHCNRNWAAERLVEVIWSSSKHRPTPSISFRSKSATDSFKRSGSTRTGWWSDPPNWTLLSRWSRWWRLWSWSWCTSSCWKIGAMSKRLFCRILFWECKIWHSTLCLSFRKKFWRRKWAWEKVIRWKRAHQSQSSFSVDEESLCNVAFDKETDGCIEQIHQGRSGFHRSWQHIARSQNTRGICLVFEKVSLMVNQRTSLSRAVSKHVKSFHLPSTRPCSGKTTFWSARSGSHSWTISSNFHYSSRSVMHQLVTILRLLYSTVSEDSTLLSINLSPFQLMEPVIWLGNTMGCFNASSLWFSKNSGAFHVHSLRSGV